MKKHILIFLFSIFFVSPVFSQESKIPKTEVPEAVLKAFKADYPKAKILGTLKENNHGLLYYEIESKDGKMKRNVSYSPAGVVSEIEEVIPASLLPHVVQIAIAKDHPKAKIKSVEKNMQGAALKFEVLLQEGKKKFEVIYSPEGVVLPK